MECIFNELSAEPVGTVAEAYNIMSHFVRAVSAVQQFGLREVRIPEEVGQNLFSLPLTPNYLVGTWLNDERVDRDLKDRFRLIVANPPLLTDEEVDALSVFERSLFCLDEPAGIPEAKGFGAAYLSDNLLLSLFTNDRWNTHQLSGWHWYLDEDGQEQTKQLTVRHFATTVHAELHKPWLQFRQIEQIQRSVDVWEKRIEFFPHLILCGDVQRQLKNVGMSGNLSQIIDRLYILDTFAAKWRSGNFDLNKLKTTTILDVSPESDLTMQLYSGRRKFKLPDGRRELFEFHIKVGNGMRFHFYPDNAEKKVYVGYVGPHLPTFSG